MDHSDLVPRILSVAQYNQLVEKMILALELSISSGCIQEVEIVFKNGHVGFFNGAGGNERATTDGLVMDADYQWRKKE